LVTHVKISHSRRIYGKNEAKKELNVEDMNKGYERFKDNKKKEEKKTFLNGLYI